MESITAGQLRAARGLLGLSQRDVAALSKVSRATIADFEAGKRQPYPRTLADLQRSLEAAGVLFTSTDELLGVKIKRASLPTAATAGEAASRPAVRSDAEPPQAAPSAERRRRVIERAAHAGVTPEQIKAGRELLGWSQLDLANKVGVSETAVSLFEREKRRLLMVDPERMRAALEAAGVEFGETGEASVINTPKEPEIALEDFSSQLEWYEQNQLRPKGVNLGFKGGVRLGFALLYLDRSAASLMLEGKELGRVKWSDGTVEFEPPVPEAERARPFEDKLMLWAGAAYRRSLAGSEPKPVHNLRQYVPRSDNPREEPHDGGSGWLKREGAA
jgi:transcriptional regulator with XRE-family HTH domain